MTNKQVTGFDLTISVEKSTANYQEVAERMRQVFRKWVFQRETSESGYDHWQCRGYLWKKKRPCDCTKEFKETVWGGHWSITSNASHSSNNFDYVMKADTRTEGPWTDKDDQFEEPPQLTRQLQEFYKKIESSGMYHWQENLEKLIERKEDRKITCVIECDGNNGKSIFCEHLEYKRKAYEIPPMTCMEDIMQCCMCIKKQACYLVDMPRAMKKDKLAGFYSGLEALKNGVMYDKRHSFKKRRIDRPQIVVFTNVMPDKELLSTDRWDFYYIVDRRLCPESEFRPPGLGL